MEIKVKIAEDFSNTPAARYISDGDFSGELFYNDILRSKYMEAINHNCDLLIDLDGTHGYATSFLDEAFGRLAIEFGKEKVLKRIKFISQEEPYLIEEIRGYINDVK